MPCALASTLANSQDLSGGYAPNQLGNAQVQVGDIFAGQTLDVEDTSGVAAATTAVGNIVSATAQQKALDFQSRQTLNGSVGASTKLTARGYNGDYVIANTSATGNAATAGTCCAATTGKSVQTIGAGRNVTADADVVIGSVDSAGVDTTAVGNTQGWNTRNGDLKASSIQSHGGSTRATTRVKSGEQFNASAYTATAVGNNVTGDTEQSPVELSVRQTVTGPSTEASVKVDQTAADNLLASATATANNVNVGASGYAAQLDNRQVNRGEVNASSEVNLDSWYGSATNVAYGMGNSAILSNAGSYAGLTNDQLNDGLVLANATFNGGAGGGAGGDLFSSSTAVGNAVSAYACSECQATFEGDSRQVNNGAVRSYNSVTTRGATGQVTGTSTAVGNTATFSVVGNGGGY